MTIQIDNGSVDTNNATILYENIFEDGTVTVNGETSDGAGLNAVEDTTFDFWTAPHTPSSITVDYGSPVECDCIGIAAHNAGTNGSTLRILTSSDGVDFTSLTSISPLTDDTIMVFFPATTARYWQFRQSVNVCSIGVVKLGKRLVFPNGTISGGVPINHATRAELMTNESQRGQYLGTRIRRVGASADINLGMMETDFVDNDMAVFESHFNSGRTFFFASSPDTWPEDHGYCWRSDSELRPSLEEGGVLSEVEMEVSVYVEQ